MTVDKKVSNKFNAIDLVNIVSREVDGGKGGGRPDMAQSGGQNLNKIDNAINELKKYILEKK